MESIWRKTCTIEERETLNREIQTEVAVIGAGMAGLLTAYQLKKASVHAVVLEAKRIGNGQTKNTTAKITSQHGLFCDAFIRKKGQKTAGQYVQANQKAIEEYEQIIQENNIECDFERTSSYVYSKNEKKLRNEAKAAAKLGIAASYVRHIEIPVPCAGAVRFEGQAQFHPLKFMKAIAEQLEIYENTPVRKVEGNLIQTAQGIVKADKIVFATHYPFVNFPGLYFTRMHQERSYVLALEDAGVINGMYIGDGEESYSFRRYGKYLLFGGQGHRTGENTGGKRYEMLRQKAKQFFPDAKEVAHWSAQDCITSDQVPFVGKYAKTRPGWFVATGFQNWGMTSSMVASKILCDMICGVENPYAKTFSSRRFSAEEVPQILKDGAKAVNGLSKRFFQVPEKAREELETGHGGIVKTKTGKAGVYKMEGERDCKVQSACCHLGCQVAWNPDEKTWECPCHGSRFDCHGNLLDGPAQEGIQYE